MSGLVIGSFTPDFEYFLRMEPFSTVSHTLGGIFLFCLPAGLLSSFIFHNAVRNSLIDNLPFFLKARFYKMKQFDWNSHFIKRWYVEVVSIIIGAGSHIFWDSFTHGQYKIFQHPSTLVGAIIIFYVIYKIPKDEGAVGKINKKYWITFSLLFILIMSICFLCGLRIKLERIGSVVVSAISACLISVTLASLLYRRCHYKSSQSRDMDVFL
jgi:hypothetical protein